MFVDGECPVSARYLGEMNGFAAAAKAAGIDFYAVLSSPHRTWADARRLRADSRPPAAGMRRSAARQVTGRWNS